MEMEERLWRWARKEHAIFLLGSSACSLNAVACGLRLQPRIGIRLALPL